MSQGLDFSIEDLWAGNVSEEVLSRAKIFSDALGGGTGVPSSQPITVNGAEPAFSADQAKAAKQVDNA